MNNKTFNQEKADAFAGSLLNILNNGALCLMISLGHRTGLFDIMSDLPPSTSEEIASKAILNERYVREWLGAMLTSGIVEYEPGNKKFFLPKEHSAFLTRAAAADNIALFMQYISILGAVEDELLNCFKNGGGVPYEKFTRFHQVMAEDSGQSVLSSLEPYILPLVPGLVGNLKKGIRVLDAGCGSWKIIIKLAELFPNSKLNGLDLSEEAINYARAETAKKNLKNVEFKIEDLTNFDKNAPEKTYDLITTFDAVHDQRRPINVLKGIYKALKDDGIYLMQDIKGSSEVHKNKEHPIGTFLYTISCMHCMTVSLSQNGEGLGAMWGEEKTREYLQHSGFKSIETNQLAHDIQNNWYVVRK